MGQSSSEQVAVLLAAAGVSGAPLGQVEVAQVGRLFGPDVVGLDDFLDATAVEATEFHDLRVGSWRIDLTREAARTGFLAAVAALALADRGLEEFGIVLATAILPSVLEIERITLSDGDRLLLIDLRLDPAVRDGRRTVDELYESLRPELRETVNRYDFADAVQRLREAGRADELPGGTLRLRDPDRPGFTVRWR